MINYRFSLPPPPPVPGGMGTEFTRKHLDLVYPYVVPKSWVEYVGEQSLFTWEFSDDVRMVLVVDGSGSVRNLRPQDLEAVGETAESAFDIAARNLAAAYQRQEFEIGIATLKDGTRIGGARGNWMAPAGGLMIGALFESMKENFHAEEFAAVAPNQQCLFAFALDDATLHSESLRLAIDDEFRSGVKPISRSWLLLNGQWPQEYPHEPSF
jgi:hypothetical protein